MKQFSVIIPTIWKGPDVCELIQRYCDSKYVKEVILIDNDFLNRPAEFKMNEKINLIQSESNLYVNPSWNLGVELSKENYITISNDDILFDVDLYFEFIEGLADPFEQWGFIGTSSDNYEREESGELHLRKYGSHNKGGWACLFTFHKSLWIPIPESIKIYYGDNFIHKYGSPIYELDGMKIKTKMSSSADTSIPWVREITDSDLTEWMNHLWKFK